MPPRKKPAPDAGDSPATGRKKTTRSSSLDGGSSAAVSRKPRSSGGTAGTSGGGPNLIIVESPSKAKTINKYLGSNFKVLASYGHVRDLPRRRKKGERVAGVNIDGGWVPTYVVVEREEGKGRRSAADILAELKREANKASVVYLAPDPDREGEAIAWHIKEALGLDDASTYRIAFNEITRSAVQHAVQNPGQINMDRVRAQEARRMLDRVVGYPLSNLLGRKVVQGSSAGRVQSVALRLVVDREREIEAFKPEEYWNLTALLAPTGTVKLPRKPLSVVRSAVDPSAPVEPEGEGEPEGKTKKKAKGQASPEGTYQAQLAEWDAKKFEPKTETDAMSVARLLDTAAYVVSKVEQKDRVEKAPPPFTTSTLQQQAHIRLHFSGQRTMQTAQRLYEGVALGSEGQVALITYMRTDSTRVSNEALAAVRTHIETSFGTTYLPDRANSFASGKSAQEAHEAIRPTDVGYTPDRVAQLGLSGDQLRLYTLIWQRFVASQMKPAIFAVTNVEVLATPTEGTARGLLKARGQVLVFDGYRKVLAPGGKQDEDQLPTLTVGQQQDRLDLVASQHFTKPPPRYNEASLVKALEKEGIGRPSTYATIIGKITSKERDYIEVRERRFYATEIGKTVTDLLVDHFPRVMDLKFTSHMEEELDDIESAKREYHQVLDEFWGPFAEALAKAEEKMPSKRGRETGESCPKCNRPLVENYSKKTKRTFIGCSGYKEGCKYIKPGEGEEERPEPVLTEFNCPNCGKPLERRAGRWGEYLSCTGRPECKTNLKIDAEGKPLQTAKPTQYTCEKCGKAMVLREGRRGPFLACTGYPKCKNAKDVDADGKPIEPADLGINCEKCGSPMAVRKGPRGPFMGCTAYPKCRNYKSLTPELREKLNLPAAPAKKATPTIEVSETCPECGAAMKLRQGRKGWFLGCSKYPKCKGVREASPELLEQVAASEAVT